MSHDPTTADLRAVLATDPPRRIAVFRALQLGDLLCVVPALRALRRRFPGAELTLIGLPWAAAFAARLPYLDHHETFPGYDGILEAPYDPVRTAAFVARMRQEPFDLAIQMHGDGSVTNGFVRDLGARRSLGYGPPGDDRLSVCLCHHPDDHEVVRWQRLVEVADAVPDSLLPEYPTTPAEEARAALLLTDVTTHPGPLVGLHAGARDPARRWPAARFAALGDALAEQYGARIVLTGSAGERAVTAAVRLATRAPALDLTGRTDLGTFAAVLARLDLLVTNDTGASHLAAATRTRSVVLFGPTQPRQWAPLDWERHTAVDARALLGGEPATALARLPVAPVLAACEQALALGREGARQRPALLVAAGDAEATWTI